MLVSCCNLAGRARSLACLGNRLSSESPLKNLCQSEYHKPHERQTERHHLDACEHIDRDGLGGIDDRRQKELLRLTLMIKPRFLLGLSIAAFAALILLAALVINVYAQRLREQTAD